MLSVVRNMGIAKGIFPLRRAELLKLRKAVELVNKYYNSHVLVFSKRRFYDEATNEAAWDDSLSLVEIERLKF